MNPAPRERAFRAFRLKWLILIALAWSQLSFALHQFDHPVSELGDRCAVCVQFDRDDDQLSDCGDLSWNSARGWMEALDPFDTIAATPRPVYSARASP